MLRELVNGRIMNNNLYFFILGGSIISNKGFLPHVRCFMWLLSGRMKRKVAGSLLEKLGEWMNEEKIHWFVV